MTDQYYDFMEGVRFDDYCENCGSPLERIDTMPDGQKVKVTHDAVVKIGNNLWTSCGETKEIVKA
jgi:hypothetical protein